MALFEGFECMWKTVDSTVEHPVWMGCGESAVKLRITPSVIHSFRPDPGLLTTDAGRMWIPWMTATVCSHVIQVVTY